jgi:hypothetical protein
VQTFLERRSRSASSPDPLSSRSREPLLANNADASMRHRKELATAAPASEPPALVWLAALLFALQRGRMSGSVGALPSLVSGEVLECLPAGSPTACGPRRRTVGGPTRLDQKEEPMAHAVHLSWSSTAPFVPCNRDRDASDRY